MKINTFITLLLIFLPAFLPAGKLFSQQPDTVPQGRTVTKSVYPVEMKSKSGFYNKLWGKHYRTIYSTPIRVQPLQLDSLLGGVRVVDQTEQLHGLLLEDKDRRLFMLRPLGGSTSFIESDFFREMYRKSDFRDTYLDTFIRDAYTMINPYTFMASGYMANKAGLESLRYRLYYLPPNSVRDTIVDGTRIQDKIVTVIDIPDINTRENIYTTPEMLDKLHENKNNRVNQQLYIRERMFDILTGDWNKIPENWNWIAENTEQGVEFIPVVIDRNHAFTRVDGLLFKQLLNILTLGFIFDYDDEYKNIKKFNKLGFTLDVALTPESVESDWVGEAEYLKSLLTDQLISEAFNELPPEIKGEDIERIKINLKARRENLPEIAAEYYRLLQYNPVLTGTVRDDRIIIDRSPEDSIRVRMEDIATGEQVFAKTYDRKLTDQIWIYGLDGNDQFEILGKKRKSSPVYLVGGKGKDTYQAEPGGNIRVYDYKQSKDSLDAVKGVRKIFSDNEKVVGYDYDRTNYHTSSFTPWGIYDSDRGIDLGSFFTYTRYGFKRLPFTYQHRIGFSYLNGFVYKGTFPLYNEKQTFIVDANFGFPNNFYNFFGFGNETDGYKDEKRKYNRVNIREFRIAPSFRQKIGRYSELTLHGAYELYKVKNPDKDRFINAYYDDDDRIFDYTNYADLGVKYVFEKKLSSLFRRLEAGIDAGWKVNLNDTGRNFPYTEAYAELNLAFSEKFMWATMAKGKVLYTNKYDFYHAATTELRGYRSYRFIGKESFYQFSDLRLDMGNLKNPLMPVKYGLFAGVDYGRVWYPGEDSNKWHLSYGGGAWFILLNKIITKYSLFGSSDTVRFMFELGFGF